jgi:hypothetical protein
MGVAFPDATSMDPRVRGDDGERTGMPATTKFTGVASVTTGQRERVRNVGAVPMSVVVPVEAETHGGGLSVRDFHGSPRARG